MKSREKYLIALSIILLLHICFEVYTGFVHSSGAWDVYPPLSSLTDEQLAQIEAKMSFQYTLYSVANWSSEITKWAFFLITLFALVRMKEK